MFNELLSLVKKHLWGKYNKYIKYRGYNPASIGESMRPFADWIKDWSTLKVNNVVEIGANFAQDADFLMCAFRLSPGRVYVFEAHPDIYAAIKKIHRFNAYNYAVYNDEKDMTFNIVPLSSKNTGISSINKLKKIETKEISVKSIRMDNFMKINKIDEIDFLKLDVEGSNFEVLEGFGARLADVHAIHIEAEHINIYNSDIFLFDAISGLLIKNGFVMVYFQRYSSQSDSFWVKKDFIKNI